MIRTLLLVTLVAVLTGCAGKALYLTSHSPKGTKYLGKFSTGSSEQVRHWLSPNSQLETVRLSYVSEDEGYVYLRAEDSTTQEILLFPKTPESLAFALSGMELSAEWR